MLRVCGQILLDILFLNAPRIHVLARLYTIDRQKRFALVFQGGGNWTLIQPVKRDQILGCR